MGFRRWNPLIFIIGWPFVFWIILHIPSVSLSVARAWLSLLLGLAGICLGLVLFARGFKLLERKRWIEDTPVSKIAGAAIGPVVFFGKVVGPYTLLSPLAHADCYYYRTVAITAEDLDRRPRESAVETMFTPLFLEDETGRVMIDPRGAELDLPPTYSSSQGNEEFDTACVHFFARHGLSNLSVNSLHEYAIKPGDEFFVLGRLAEKQAPSERVRSPRSPEDEGSYLSAEAALLQRRQMLEQIGVAKMDQALPSAPACNPSEFDLHPRVVVCRGSNHEPFVLANRPPSAVLEAAFRHAELSIWGGPALAVASLAMLMKGLNLW